VLLTQEAWFKLRENMAAAGFPVVNLLGMFRLPLYSYEGWLYQVVAVVGKPLARTFDGIRKGDQLWPM
jgi:hypothetical protein